LIYENAVKYSPEQSKIITEYNEIGNDVIIKIANSGYKYTENQMKSMFTKFYRVCDEISEESGSGVGLYLAKEICDLHKMSITLSSKEDTESTDQNSLGIFEVTIKLTKK
jgi:signal transduction histidine kinase